MQADHILAHGQRPACGQEDIFVTEGCLDGKDHKAGPGRQVNVQINPERGQIFLPAHIMAQRIEKQEGHESIQQINPVGVKHIFFKID